MAYIHRMAGKPPLFFARFEFMGYRDNRGTLGARGRGAESVLRPFGRHI